MSRIIKPDEAKDVDCEECPHLKYESDIDTMVCTRRLGCDKSD